MSSCYAQQVMCSENARRSGLNKRCITLATINCRAFAREVVFWTILKVFEFIVYCLQCSSYIFSDILLQMKQTVKIVHLAKNYIRYTNINLPWNREEKCYVTLSWQKNFQMTTTRKRHLKSKFALIQASSILFHFI